MMKLVSRLAILNYRRSTFNCEILSRINGCRNYCAPNPIFKSYITPTLIKHVHNKCWHYFPTSKLLFHTSRVNNALPPLLLILMRPLTRIFAVVFGRSIRVWWRKLPQERREKILLSLKKRKLIFFALLSSVPLGSMYFYFTHIEDTPITKRKRFIAFSNDQIMRLANIEQDVIAAQCEKQIVSAHHPVYCRVSRVVYRLLDSNKDVEGINDFSWRIVVVDSPEIANAFVLPNGTIFIYSGMLNLCSNDNQLSIVLAHEMSHAILHHTAERMSNAQLIEFMLFVPFVLIWAVLPDLGALFAQWFSGTIAKMLVHLPFSRLTEMEADDVGLTLAAKACFDVREATCFWKKMKVFQANDVEDIEWLSTHPSYDTRVTFLDGLIPSALKLREYCQCPKLSSKDPRVILESFYKLAPGKQLSKV